MYSIQFGVRREFVNGLLLLCAVADCVIPQAKTDRPSLRPQDKVAGLPAGLGARWRRYVGVSDLLPVFRIQRRAIAEHGVWREVIELQELVDKWILTRQIMGHAGARFTPFEDRHARRPVVQRRARQAKALRDDFRLDEVHRIQV